MEEIPSLYNCTDFRSIHGSRGHICQLSICNRYVRGCWGPECWRRNVDGRDLLHISGPIYDHYRTVLQYTFSLSQGRLIFVGEFLASGMLMFVIFALTDPGNIPAGNLTPLILFFLIFGIGACLGWETGYAVDA